jgi:hypothetical protein
MTRSRSNNVPTKLIVVSTCLLLLQITACAPGGNKGVALEGQRGQVVDQTSGAAVAGASVFQVWWGKGVAGEPRPARVLRWVDANGAGEFEFKQSTTDAVRAWANGSGGPEYGFFHSDYGLVRTGASRGEGTLVLGARQLDAAGRHASELSLCGSRPADEVLADVAQRHCPRAN